MTLLPEFCLKKVAAVEPISCFVLEDLSAGVIFTLFQIIKTFLLSIPVKTCGDHLLRI